MTRLPDGAPLSGPVVRLEPLREADLPELGGLLSEPEVYAHGYVMHARPGSAKEAIELARERFLEAPALDGRGGGRLPYAVRLTEGGTLVGTSALLDVELTHERGHIGATLYGPRWWGTAVNPAAKLLLLGHLFEDCGLGRVKLQTDRLNTRSRAAIAKLGAIEEGVLRRHTRRADGTFRDSVVFSVLASEWPAVRAGLEARISSG